MDFPTDPLILNLDATERDVYRKFIVGIRCRLGYRVVRRLPKGRSHIVPNLTQSAHIGTIPEKYWLFVVKLIYRGRKLEILLQRYIFICLNLSLYGAFVYNNIS